MPPRPEKVYYFGTCLIDLCYPQAGMAGIELLRREGIQVVYPQQQSCCGQPAYNSGFREEAGSQPSTPIGPDRKCTVVRSTSRTSSALSLFWM